MGRAVFNSVFGEGAGGKGGGRGELSQNMERFDNKK